MNTSRYNRKVSANPTYRVMPQNPTRDQRLAIRRLERIGDRRAELQGDALELRRESAAAAAAAVALGLPIVEIAALIGCTRSVVHAWVRGYPYDRGAK